MHRRDLRVWQAALTGVSSESWRNIAVTLIDCGYELMRHCQHDCRRWSCLAGCPNSQSLCFGTLLSSSETRDWPPGVAFAPLASTMSRALIVFP